MFDHLKTIVSVTIVS